MSPERAPVSATRAMLLGLASLAAAMGIGRFAFTPLLPLMQQSQGLTMAQGAWLAMANYLGYLLGALASFAAAPRPGAAARWGLAAVAATTLAMAAADGMVVWFVLRLLAGAASAFVLVGASAWALAQLAARGRPAGAGAVFAGVGIGICGAGLLALVVGSVGAAPTLAWALLGLAALAVTLLAWRQLAAEVGEMTVAAGPAAAPARLDRRAWTLVICYGAFGFGYIVPATFLPAAARELVPDPAVFGWTWPLFGLAAALSTVLAATRWRHVGPRRVGGWSLVLMAVGVAAPLLQPGLAAITLSAACVGGSFMVMTMAGVQEARRLAGGSPARLIAALTAAFALGQLLGPVLVGAGAARWSGPIAVLVLLASAVALLHEPTPIPTLDKEPTP